MKDTWRLILSCLLAAAVFLLFLHEPDHVQWKVHKLRPNSPEAMRQQRLEKRIERRATGWSKPDSPGEFAEYYALITTPDDPAGALYPPNHDVIELRKARTRALLLRKSAATLPWIERGPGNVSGRTRAIVVDPDDPTRNTWFAAAVSGGVWKTTDGGLSWTNKTPLLPNLATTCLVMAPSNHNILYAGTGEGFFNTDAVRGNGIWMSTDRGNTWTQIPSTAGTSDFSFVNRIIADPTNAQTLLAATNTGIFRTTDGGATWIKPYSGRVQHLLANPSNFSTQLAGVNSIGVLRSTNAGATWTLASSLRGRGRVELAWSSLDTARAYAVQDYSGSSALFVSADGGASWTLATGPGGSNPNWLGTQGWYNNTLVVHPFDRNTVFVGGIDIWQLTITQGTTTPFIISSAVQVTNWYPDDVHPFVHADHHALIAVPTGPSSFWLVDGNDGGVEVSRDGGSTWSKTLNGYNTTQFYGADKMRGASRYIGGMQDNGTWLSASDPGPLSPWFEQLGGDGFDVSWHYQDGNKIVISAYNNDIWRTLDQGATWYPATLGLDDAGDDKAPFITSIAKTNTDPDLLFTIGLSGVWRTDNFAADWTSSPIPTDWGDAQTGKVCISLKNPQIVWAGIHMSTKGKVQVSTDGGLTFHPVSLYPNDTLGRVSGLATHSTQDSTAYVLFSLARKPKVLRTTDLGATWTDISGFGSNGSSSNGFPDVAVYCLLVMPDVPNEIWVGTEIGLFVSTDDGVSWTYADNGLPAVAVWQLRIVDDEVIVATHGRGVWSVSRPGLASSTPPVAALSPRLGRMAQGADGNLTVAIGLRSPYDSTVVESNGLRFLSLGPNATPVDTTVKYVVTSHQSLTFSVCSYRNGAILRSAPRMVTVTPYGAARLNYSDSFDTANANYVADGFSLQTPTGFTNQAYHTPHPYTTTATYTLMLTVPIIVGAADATISFDEVAIVEPGESWASFGNPDFYDYCVVEGSKDGLAWIPFEDGYDARRDPAWLTAWNSNAAGTASLLRTHQMTMLNRFVAGDRVLVRFRLYSDPGAVGWGWMIDNLKIQPDLSETPLAAASPTAYRLYENYPNPMTPFNPSTAIRFRIPVETNVCLRVYDMQGRLVATLLDHQLSAGEHTVRWDASTVASGVYFYRLQAGSFMQTKKLLLIR